MSTYYVALTGNNGNSGAIGSPWRNIGYAVQQLTAGDTLYIRSGTWTDNADRIDSQVSGGTGYTVPSGTSSGWGTSYVGAITVAGYTGETVTIQPPGNHGVRFDTNTVSYFVLRNLVIDMVNQTGVGGTNPSGIDIKQGSHHILVEDVEVKNGKANGIGCGENGDTCHDIVFRRVNVHNVGDTATVNSGYGFYIAFANDVTVEDCQIHDCVGYGIHCYTGGGFTNSNERHIIRRNRIYSNGTGGGTNFGIVYGNGANGLIYNNIIYSNRGGVLVYFQADSIGVYHNTITANTPGYGIEFQTSPMTASIAKNNILYNNAGDINDTDGTPYHTYSNNPTGNPNFTNAAGGDYSLQATSAAAIDQGVTIAAVTTDILGMSRATGAAPDAGAYEYIPPSSSSIPVMVHHYRQQGMA